MRSSTIMSSLSRPPPDSVDTFRSLTWEHAHGERGGRAGVSVQSVGGSGRGRGASGGERCAHQREFGASLRGAGELMRPARAGDVVVELGLHQELPVAAVRTRHQLRRAPYAACLWVWRWRVDDGREARGVRPEAWRRAGSRVAPPASPNGCRGGTEAARRDEACRGAALTQPASLGCCECC